MSPARNPTINNTNQDHVWGFVRAMGRKLPGRERRCAAAIRLRAALLIRRRRLSRTAADFVRASGKMEAFYNERDNRGMKPGTYTNDAAFMHEYGMELLGPPLVVE